MTTYSFLVYGKEQPKRFTGILGDIDMHVVHMLLEGVKEIPQEEFQGNIEKAAIWYDTYLKEQDIHASLKKTTGATLWFEVNLETSPIEEFPQYHELDKGDQETLVWRTFWYPTIAGTTTECLGFSVGNRECKISGVTAEALIQKIVLPSA